MTKKIDAALSDLIANVRNHYGARTAAIYRIISPRDLDELDRSDAEIVVLLADDNWRMLDEQRALGKFTFDALLHHDVYVRAWPFPAADWHAPLPSQHPRLIHELREHAIEVRVAA